MKTLKLVLLALAFWWSDGASIAFAQVGVQASSYAKTAVTLTGSSQQLLGAPSGRNGFIVYNPTGNANIYVDPAGGTVASETGLIVPPGTSRSFVGIATPISIVTVIGTSTQTIYVWDMSNIP
jgi:hypothetical protein